MLATERRKVTMKNDRVRGGQESYWRVELTFLVQVVTTLDLISGCSYSPNKIGREIAEPVSRTEKCCSIQREED